MTRTSNTLPPQKSSTARKRAGRKLAGIDFRIYYRPGTKNGKPDALSWYWEYRPEKGASENQPITTVLQKTYFTGSVSRYEVIFVCSSDLLGSLLARRWSKEFEEQVKEAGERDREYQQTLKELEVVWTEYTLDD